jgi:hypothetical protein
MKQQKESLSATRSPRNSGNTAQDLFDTVIVPEWGTLKKMALRERRKFAKAMYFTGQTADSQSFDTELQIAAWMACQEHLESPRGSLLRRAVSVFRRNQIDAAPDARSTAWKSEWDFQDDRTAHLDDQIALQLALQGWAEQQSDLDQIILAQLIDGHNVTEVAQRHGVSRQAIAKRITAFRTQLLNLGYQVAA